MGGIRQGKMRTSPYRRAVVRPLLLAIPLIGLCTGGVSVGAAGVIAEPSPNCSIARISGFNVNGVSITSVSAVAAVPPNPEYCLVQGSVSTRGEDAAPGKARFVLKLPAAWNQRFLFFGCGGNCGSVKSISANTVDVAAALPLGYAVVNTDAGHEQDLATPDPTWILLAPGVPNTPAIIDFYYRAVHQVTIAAKTLVGNYYAKNVEHSYFDGCSTGGRQALMEGDRYPQDFDGLIAGDPIMDLDTQRAATIKQAKAFLPPAAYIPYELIPAIDAAVDENCDALDGVVDGLIQNPALCSFDPHALVPRVLSEAQAEGLERYLEAIIDSFGRPVAPGMIVGSYASSGFEGQAEISMPAADPSAAQPWGGTGLGPSAWVIGDAGIRYYVEYDPSYNVNQDWPERANVIALGALRLLEERQGAGDSDDPRELHEYLRQGRKLILYHGLSDAQASPYRTRWFYSELAKDEQGYESLQMGARLFMVPGMGHCGAGSGPNSFETLTALDEWVSHDVAPDAIMAANGATGRTMPLCPFPAEARYIGGPVDAAGSWVCPAKDQRLLETGPDGVLAGADDHY